MKDTKGFLIKEKENLKIQLRIKKRKLKEKGITLIALVVTIIVLLILTGVTLNMTLADNGLFSRTKEAVEKYKKAEKDESKDISILEEMIDGKGTDIEEVTDKNPGVLEVIGNTYVINSIEDLVFFANDVSSENNYEGKTVKLGLSLDFNSSKSYVEPYRTDYGKYGYDGPLKTLLTSAEGFKPIGIGFKGTFDGNRFKLYNLFICRNLVENLRSIGLFGYNSGIIRDIGIENLRLNCVSSYNWDCIGGLVGINYGEIENCYVSGDISCESSGESINLGGIVGSNANKLRNSFADVDLMFRVSSFKDDEKVFRIGGVAGVNDSGEGVEVINVYNTGKMKVLMPDIKGGVKHQIYYGGICCYNFEEITSSYSIAPLEVDNGSCLLYMGGVVGREQAPAKVNNNYYLGNVIKYPSTGNLMDEYKDKSQEMTSENMKIDDSVERLNGEQDIWTNDVNNINDGYPIFKWQNLMKDK